MNTKYKQIKNIKKLLLCVHINLIGVQVRFGFCACFRDYREEDE